MNWIVFHGLRQPVTASTRPNRDGPIITLKGGILYVAVGLVGNPYARAGLDRTGRAAALLDVLEPPETI